MNKLMIVFFFKKKKQRVKKYLGKILGGEW